jgi:hypothetical protein
MKLVLCNIYFNTTVNNISGRGGNHFRNQPNKQTKPLTCGKSLSKVYHKKVAWPVYTLPQVGFKLIILMWHFTCDISDLFHWEIQLFTDINIFFYKEVYYHRHCPNFCTRLNSSNIASCNNNKGLLLLLWMHY